MRTTDVPAKISRAFALNGDKNTIPVTNSTEQENTGAASLEKGFPPVTMLARSAGGIPPDGRDFNGILFTLSDAVKWVSAGMSYPFDSAFASSIGGYPKGAIIPNSVGDGSWLNTIEQNTSTPEVSGASLTGWVPYAPRGVTGISGLSGTSRTLSTLEASRPRINLSGTLTSNINITVPAWVMCWEIINLCTGNFQVIVRSNTGSGVILPQGLKTVVFCYGAEVIKDSGDAANFDVIPVRNGGTAANTKEQALINLGGFPISGGVINGEATVKGNIKTQGGNVIISDAEDNQLAIISANADGSLNIYSNKSGHYFGINDAGGFYTSQGTGIYEAGQRVYSNNNPPPAQSYLSVGSSNEWRDVNYRSGRIMQGGIINRNGDVNTLTFPFRFPTACLGVFMQQTAQGGVSTENIIVTSASNDSFTVVMRASETWANWLAIGY